MLAVAEETISVIKTINYNIRTLATYKAGENKLMSQVRSSLEELLFQGDTLKNYVED